MDSGAGKDAPASNLAYRRRAAISLAVILLFLTAIITLNLYGKAQRVYASGTTTITVDSPEEAYAVWSARKVSGRVLLLFGKYPHVKRTSDYEGVRQLDSSNFIELAAFNNIVRRVYYIIPDDSWEETISHGSFGAIRRAPGIERGMYLFNLIGIPIIATTPSSLPHISETPLVYINSMQFDESAVRDYLLKRGISPDITISYNGG